MDPNELLKSLQTLEILFSSCQFSYTQDLDGMQYQEGVESLNNIRIDQDKLLKTIHSLFIKYCISEKQMNDYKAKIDSMNGLNL